MLENINNYKKYEELIKNGTMVISVNDITIDSWKDYFYGLLNIFKDGIETDFVQKSFVTIDFGDETVELSLIDLWFNLIMWNLLINTDESIRPKHIFFEKELTGKSIKKYIDKHCIEINRRKINNITLNNIINESLKQFFHIDDFSFYLANTFNLEDTIDLMNKNERFNELMHLDLSNVPLEDVKNVGMELTYEAIGIMKNSKDLLGYDHCLADNWRANEGVNPRQYKEFSFNIGTKPNNEGGIYPYNINNSYINGGVSEPYAYLMDSATARTAQILSKNNVGTSGAFARILGLNNTDTKLHPDPNYDCHTKNYEIITIKNKSVLGMLKNRWYRLKENGMEYLLKDTDEHLIGQTIYLRSPITCASAARGDGICYKCYGELAYVNNDINPGKYAAENLSSKLTQRLLSAKHLLETNVKTMNWTDGFSDFFDIEGNCIKVVQDANFKGYTLIIDPEEISLDDEDDEESEESYNEYITEFKIQCPDGELITCGTTDHDKLYISKEMNKLIRTKADPVDGKVNIPMNVLNDALLFFIVLHNSGLSKTMDRIKDIIDKNSVTRSMDRNQLLQEFIDTIIEGGLKITSVHCEVLIMNQIRDIEDILEKPNWKIPNAPYQILTTNQALTNNPNVVISLMYQKLSKTLYAPLTFRKNKPSFMDLFFMEQPQEFLYNNDIITEGVEETDVEQNLKTAITREVPEEDEE